MGQTTDASIVGEVLTSAGAAVASATVTARDESTGFQSVLHTTEAGRFSFLQLPLGGPYTVTVRMLGFRAQTRGGYRLAITSRVTIRFTLEEQAAELAPITVVGTEPHSRAQVIGANYRVSGEQLATLPTVNRNFTDLASLAPTVGSQLSLNGQRWTSTEFRLDGVQSRNAFRAGEYGAGPFTVSMEAIREFEVNSNVYDVTEGRQGGGAVRAVTNNGTNTLSGSVFSFYKGSSLSAASDFQGRGRDLRDFNAVQWGGSIGGPIIRDRLNFFAAFDGQRSSEPLFNGLIRSSRDEIANQVSGDSLSRLLQILETRYGTDSSRTQLGRLNRTPAANNGFARLDWELSPRHHVTFRDDFTTWSSPLSGGVDQPIALWEARSDFSSRENQALTSLRSTFGSATQNELKLAFSSSRRRLSPVSNLPRGFVRIQSSLPDSTTGDIRVQFGGNRLAPDDSREKQFQLIDVLSTQRGHVLLSVGTDNSFTRLSSFVADAQSGLFEFESLADLEAENPSRYSRSLPLLASQPTTHQSVLELGLFAQGEWRPSARLTLTGGLRWDGTAFLTSATFNPAAETALGVRTDRKPSDWTKIQPRVQAVWDLRGDGRDIVRAGAGRFASQLPYYEQHNQLLNDGLQLTDIIVTGASIPTPDYPLYRADPSTIPGLPEGSSVPPSYVNLVTSDFRTPSTWKASVAYQHRLFSWMTLTGTLLGAHTTGNYQYFDRNLRTTPAFTLDNEGGRPVFVPAATIDAKGRTLNRNAWITTAVGRVLELTPAGAAEQYATVAEGAISLPNAAGVSFSYTYNHSRDNSTFGCCLARTASTFTAIKGDPRDLSGSWGPSDLDFTNKIVLAGTSPAWRGFLFSARLIGLSGRPFSAVVNGDINGDEGNGNDLAFVFDPDDPSTPSAIAASMRKVLANPDNVARDYLRRNLGRVADRNGARAPWTARTDVRLAKRFGIGTAQRIEATVDVFNFLNLLNRDWGAQYLLPVGISTQNPVSQRVSLLNVVGFDQATQQYRYTVNENFGVLQRGGDPYQIQLGVRYGF